MKHTFPGATIGKQISGTSARKKVQMSLHAKTCKYNININIYYYILLISLSFIYFYYRLYIEYYIYNYYYNIYNISLYYVQEFQDQAQESLMFLQLRMIMDN